MEGKGAREGEAFWAGNRVDCHSLGWVGEGCAGCAHGRKAGEGLGQMLA